MASLFLTLYHKHRYTRYIIFELMFSRLFVADGPSQGLSIILSNMAGCGKTAAFPSAISSDGRGRRLESFGIAPFVQLLR